MALGVYGFGCEDSLTHLMNYVWPNMFEISPHMIQSFNDAVDGLRVSVGPGKVLQYTMQVSVLLNREREGGRGRGKEGRERGREGEGGREGGRGGIEKCISGMFPAVLSH